MISHKISTFFRLFWSRRLFFLGANPTKNLMWLLLDHIARMILGFFVLAIMARSLGPDGFGRLNYAIAFVSLFGFLSALGINQILIREILSENNKSVEVLGTGFYLKLIGSLLLVFLTTLISSITSGLHSLNSILVIILSIATILQAFDVIEYWFQAHQFAKYTAISRFIAFLVSSGLKIVICLSSQSLILLSLTYLVDALIAALLMLFFYKKHQILFVFHANKKIAKQLIKEGLPLILSSIFVIIYQRIDQVFLQFFTTNSVVGIYTAAVRISEIPFFIGSILSSVALPLLVSAQQKSNDVLHNQFRLIFSALGIIALTISFIFTIFSHHLIAIIFGSSYSKSIPILQIHIWSLIFVYFGLIQGIWLIIKKKSHLSFMFTIVGAISNIILNLLLIPRFEAVGASIATIISYAIAGVGMNFFFKETKELGRIQLESMRIKSMKNVINHLLLS